jgi:hypothetical protein
MFTDAMNQVLLDALGQIVTHWPSGSNILTTAGTTLTGIFDNPGNVLLYGKVGVMVSEPQVAVLTSAITAMLKNDRIRVGTTAYYVVKWQDDGEGMRTVTLSENEVR